jgi:hypothetical protein
MAPQNTSMDSPSHGAGTREGESRAIPVAQRPTRKASDATGINPDQRAPISPKMPHLPPA